MIFNCPLYDSEISIIFFPELSNKYERCVMDTDSLSNFNVD